MPWTTFFSYLKRRLEQNLNKMGQQIRQQVGSCTHVYVDEFYMLLNNVTTTKTAEDQSREKPEMEEYVVE